MAETNAVSTEFSQGENDYCITNSI